MKQFAKPSSLRLSGAAILAISLSVSIIPASRAAIVVVVSTFSMAPNSTLNIQGNALIVRNANPGAAAATLAQVTAKLTLGINLANSGYWDGVGNATGGAIQSSTAALTAGSFTKGVGVMVNEFSGSPIYADFFGVPVGINDVLVRYTWEGDADLSGLVDATDQFLLDNAVANSLTGWFNADLDYSGAVDATDQFLLDNAVANGAGSNPPLVGGKDGALVPEPGSVALLAVGTLGLLGRRRSISKN